MSSYLIAGTITDSDGSPAERIVRVYNREIGGLIGETTSDPTTGYYEIESFVQQEVQRIVLDSATGDPIFNDIVDRIITSYAGEFSTGGGAWDVSTASYSGSIALNDIDSGGIDFSPNGLKMYTVGYGNDRVYEYSLATAWDVTTAYFVQSLSVINVEPTVRGVRFRPDGVKMYIVGNGADKVSEHNLSEAWNISTSSFVRSFYVGTQDSSPCDVFFRPDGLVFYVAGYGADGVNAYNLLTAWELTSVSHISFFSTASNEASPRSVFFRPDGLIMYVCGTGGDAVVEYELGEAWDITTSTYVRTKIVSAAESRPQGVFLRSDGLKMYVTGDTSNRAHQYDLGS